MLVKFLYVKRHKITGLKYFGMTTNNNPEKYRGSGTHWRRHVKKHGGFKHVETVSVWKFDNQELCSEFALKFSEENNIVESKEWANEIPEDGLSGYPKGIKKSQEAINKLRKPKSETHKQNISLATKGRIRYQSISEREKRSKSVKNTGFTLAAKDRIWINNGHVLKRIYPEDLINFPDWNIGQIKGTLSDRVCYTNPVTGKNRFICSDDSIPEGFIRGMTKKVKQ